MAIEWYTPAQRKGTEVKLSSSSILFTDAGVAKLVEINGAFKDASSVKLGWDAKTSTIAIAPADHGDKMAFKYSKRGRSATTRAVSAAKFFAHFNISTSAQASDSISIEAGNGCATFRVPAPSAASHDGAKRRGRRPKNAVA